MFSTPPRGILKKPTQVPSVFPAGSGTHSDSQSANPSPQITSSRSTLPTSRSASSSTGWPRLSSFSHPQSSETEDKHLKLNLLGSGNQNMTPKLLAIGGGKGGIGKSFISANLAVSLAKMGYSVALVDLDFGAANLHTCLGIPCPKVSLFDFVSSNVEGLEEVGVATGVPNLTLFGGGQEFWQQVRPQSIQKIRLITRLQKLNAHYVILDLGAGTHVNTLDFFIYSHAGIVVVVPEPTSIENVYVFLKSVLFRRIQSIVKALNQDDATEQLVANLGDPKITQPPIALIKEFAAKNPELGSKILEMVHVSQLGVVMNQVRTKTDADIGSSIAQISQKYFGFNASFLGSTPYDDAAWKSVRNRKPLHHEFQNSPVALGLTELSKHIANEFLPQSIDSSEIRHRAAP